MKFKFKADKRGYGDLELYKDGKFEGKWKARSGSCDKEGKLVNSISSGIWTMRTAPVKTKEKGMVVDGFGWKIRLWTPKGQWSHFLVHPDSNKPGTRGCIGIQGAGKLLYKTLCDIYEENDKTTIPVEVGDVDERFKIAIEEGLKEERVDKGKAYQPAKSIKKAAIRALVAGVASTSASQDIPVGAISTVLVWLVSFVVDWLKHK